MKINLPSPGPVYDQQTAVKQREELIRAFSEVLARNQPIDFFYMNDTAGGRRKVVITSGAFVIT
jgi:hypothetical protein